MVKNCVFEVEEVVVRLMRFFIRCANETWMKVLDLDL